MDSLPKNENGHHLLPLKLNKVFVLLNTKSDILKDVGNQTDLRHH